MIRYPRSVWNEMQRDAMPIFHRCPSCGEVTATDEPSGRVLGIEVEMEDGEFWWIPQYKCILCGFAYDGVGSICDN